MKAGVAYTNIFHNLWYEQRKKGGKQKVKKITDAVHSTLQLSELDCASCKMKPVCDEVEGMRELHFKSIKGD